MIIPENLTLEELIGAMKAQETTLLAQNRTEDVMELSPLLNLAEVIKRELDRKVDNQ